MHSNSRIRGQSKTLTIEELLLNEVEDNVKNYADQGECYWPSWTINSLQDLHNSSRHMKAEFNNCFIIFYFLIDFFQNISLFLGTVSGYKQMFFWQMLLKK